MCLEEWAYATPLGTVHGPRVALSRVSWRCCAGYPHTCCSDTETCVSCLGASDFSLLTTVSVGNSLGTGGHTHPVQRVHESPTNPCVAHSTPVPVQPACQKHIKTSSTRTLDPFLFAQPCVPLTRNPEVKVCSPCAHEAQTCERTCA